MCILYIVQIQYLLVLSIRTHSASTLELEEKYDLLLNIPLSISHVWGDWLLFFHRFLIILYKHAAYFEINLHSVNKYMFFFYFHIDQRLCFHTRNTRNRCSEADTCNSLSAWACARTNV